MAKIAHFGTGMLGSGMVEAMLRHGHQVTVWNRTIEKTKLLEALGARVATDPAEAARGADRLHFTLNDDASVDAVLAACAPSLGPSTFVVDHTTTSPLGTSARHRRLTDANIPFIHAPVFMSPQMARDAKGLMLACGPRALFERVRVDLEQMTTELWFVGERVDLAAANKLFGNAMIFAIVGGLADIFTIAEALGIDATDAHAVFTRFKAANTIDTRGAKMARGDFAASFELTMARKDLRLMLETRTERPLAVLPGIAARFDALIAAGRGHQDFGVIAAPAVERWPAERNDPFALLESNHRSLEARLDELANSIAQGSDAGIREFLAYFGRAVRRHETDEELSVFPRLGDHPELTPTLMALTVAHRHHEELHERLRAIVDGGPSGANATELSETAKRLETACRAHIAIEEKLLFPAARRLLDDKTCRAIVAEMDGRRGR